MDEERQLEILVAVCRNVIDCHFNLKLIYEKIETDSLIKEKILGNLTGNREKEIFSNQLTIVMNHDNYFKTDDDLLNNSINYKVNKCKNRNKASVINIKIFRNGKIMTVGGFSVNDSKNSITYILDKIKNINSNYSIKHLLLNEHFNNPLSYVKYIQNNYVVIYRLLYMFNIDISNLKLGEILNVNKRYNIESWNDVIGSLNNDENYLLCKIIQIMNILYNYFVNKEIVEILDNENNKLHINLINVINDLYDNKTITLYTTFFEDIVDFQTKIVNYNSKYVLGFNLDRQNVLNLIKNNYFDRVVSCNFNPTRYQAVQIKFISSIDDIKLISNYSIKKNEKNNNLSTTDILVFRTGEIMITGSRIWSKNLEACDFIKEVLLSNKELIYVNKEINIKKKKQNPLIVKCWYVNYINAVKTIENSPRNTFILKNLGLYNKYKNIYLTF